MKSKSSIISAAFVTFAVLFILPNYPALAGDKNAVEIHPTCGNALSPQNRDRLLRKLLLDKDRPALVSEKTLLSDRGLFLIHYATEGVNKPPMDDKNGNGTPDFVDSVAFYFEKAYNLQVEKIGFLSPVPDDGSGGSTAFDVYLWDLGNGDDYDVPDRSDGGQYGITVPYNQRVQISAAEPYYTYITIDNDFSPTDSIRPDLPAKPYRAFKTFGVEGMKITATHEFQHAVQFTYGFPSGDPALAIMEMCGVYMEYRQYPQIKDYFQYVNYMFKNMNLYPFGTPDPWAGYGNSTFMQFLNKSYGDAVFKKLWENAGTGMDVYNALNSGLNDQGTSLDDKYTEFAGWLYHTGKRSFPGMYLDDSKLLNEMDFFQNESLGDNVMSMAGTMRPYEIRLLRLAAFPADKALSEDSLDVIIVNRDLKGASSQGAVERSYSFSFNKTQLGGMDPIQDLPWYFAASNDSHISFTFVPRPGVKAVQTDLAFPNPYYPATDEGINLPVPASSGLYANNNLSVVIYSPDMEPVYSGFIKVGVSSDKALKTVRVPLGKDIKSGIYLFKVSDGDNTEFGKFAVRQH